MPDTVRSTAPAAIGSLISKLEMLTSELQTHTAAMNYTGTDEFNVHTFDRHEFDRDASKTLHDLSQRLEDVSNDLYSAEEERKSFATLTLPQKKARTLAFEEGSEDAQAGARRDAELEQDPTARQESWARMPPE
jgi:hypothetical protein